MRYRATALLFFLIVGAIELAGFASQVATMANGDRLLAAADQLGIAVEAVRTRITLLVPLAAVIAAVALSVAYGAVVGDSRRHGRIICAALLALSSLAQLASGILLDPSAFWSAALLGVLAYGSAWFVRVAPDSTAAEVG